MRFYYTCFFFCDAAICCNYVAPVINKVKMIMEQWWIGNERKILKCSKKILSVSGHIHNTYHVKD
jgi:hypothetical protein